MFRAQIINTFKSISDSSSYQDFMEKFCYELGYADEYDAQQSCLEVKLFLTIAQTNDNTFTVYLFDEYAGNYIKQIQLYKDNSAVAQRNEVTKKRKRSEDELVDKVESEGPKAKKSRKSTSSKKDKKISDYGEEEFKMVIEDSDEEISEKDIDGDYELWKEPISDDSDSDLNASHEDSQIADEDQQQPMSKISKEKNPVITGKEIKIGKTKAAVDEIFPKDGIEDILKVQHGVKIIKRLGTNKAYSVSAYQQLPDNQKPYCKILASTSARKYLKKQLRLQKDGKIKKTQLGPHQNTIAVLEGVEVNNIADLTNEQREQVTYKLKLPQLLWKGKQWFDPFTFKRLTPIELEKLSEEERKTLRYANRKAASKARKKNNHEFGDIYTSELYQTWKAEYDDEFKELTDSLPTTTQSTPTIQISSQSQSTEEDDKSSTSTMTTTTKNLPSKTRKQKKQIIISDDEEIDEDEEFEMVIEDSDEDTAKQSMSKIRKEKKVVAGEEITIGDTTVLVDDIYPKDGIELIMKTPNNTTILKRLGTNQAYSVSEYQALPDKQQILFKIMPSNTAKKNIVRQLQRDKYVKKTKKPILGPHPSTIAVLEGKEVDNIDDLTDEQKGNITYKLKSVDLANNGKQWFNPATFQIIKRYNMEELSEEERKQLRLSTISTIYKNKKKNNHEFGAKYTPELYQTWQTDYINKFIDLAVSQPLTTQSTPTDQISSQSQTTETHDKSSTSTTTTTTKKITLPPKARKQKKPTIINDNEKEAELDQNTEEINQSSTGEGVISSQSSLETPEDTTTRSTLNSNEPKLLRDTALIKLNKIAREWHQLHGQQQSAFQKQYAFYEQLAVDGFLDKSEEKYQSVFQIEQRSIDKLFQNVKKQLQQPAALSITDINQLTEKLETTKTKLEQCKQRYIERGSLYESQLSSKITTIVRLSPLTSTSTSGHPSETGFFHSSRTVSNSSARIANPLANKNLLPTSSSSSLPTTSFATFNSTINNTPHLQTTFVVNDHVGILIYRVAEWKRNYIKFKEAHKLYKTLYAEYNKIFGGNSLQQIKHVSFVYEEEKLSTIHSLICKEENKCHSSTKTLSTDEINNLLNTIDVHQKQILTHLAEYGTVSTFYKEQISKHQTPSSGSSRQFT